uniref:Uncharacterized protein n=1 Tax=Ditylenchus dipsaci TaxID=166011 RepID=A0A915CQ65_9BILA
MRSSTISISNRMQVNSKSSISDPIPSIASAIDSGRERQKLAAGGTRLREKIQNHKTGSDGIRTRSSPLRHSTELKTETNLTEVPPPSQVTQF